MDTVAFLRFLWPSTAARYVVTCESRDDTGKKYFFNKSAGTIERAARLALKLGGQGFDTYHACATYDPKTRDRKNVSVVSLRSVWLDLDVARPGSDKANVYPDGAAALEDVARFITAASLPHANLVTSSGWGIHVYWVLDRDLTRDEWTPVAHGLRQLAQQHGVKCDLDVTTTASRVMRTPGTWNYKNKHDPRPASVLGCTGQYVPVARMPVVAVAPTVIRAGAPLAYSDLSAGMHRPSWMENIVQQCPAMQKMFLTGSAPGSGCESRELWLAMMGLAAFTENGHLFVRPMSRHHATLDDAELDRQWQYTLGKKAAGQVGPGTCMTIAAGGGQASICATCPHNGQIVSPIVLGYNAPAAPVPQSSTTGLLAASGSPRVVATPVLQPNPEPPARYVALPQGGYGGHVEDEDGNYQLALIMAGKISRIERRREEVRVVGKLVETVVLLVQYHANGNGAGTTIRIPIASLTLKSDVILSGLGFIIPPGKQKEAIQMMRSWADMLAANSQSRFEAKHYGWSEHGAHKCFVAGDRVYWDNGAVETAMSPPGSSHTYDLKGTLDSWRAAAQQHLDVFHPGLQLMVAGAFAAPLVQLSGRPGGRLLSIVAPETGVGKTSASDLAQSVWGSEQGTIRMNATANAVPEFVGQLRSLPVFWDEARGNDPVAFMNLMFSIVEGRGRMRLTSSADLRETASWNNMVIVSSNFSIRDRADTMETVSGEGPQKARVFECHVSTPRTVYPGLHLHLAQAVVNRGQAGDAFARYVVPRWQAISHEIAQLELGLTKMLNAPSSARFHVSTMALLLTGACVATAAGIVRFDIVALRDYLISVYNRIMSESMTVETSLSGNSQESFALRVLEEFLSANSATTLVTNTRPSIRGRPPVVVPVKQPARQGAEPVTVHIMLQQHQILLDGAVFSMWATKSGRLTGAVSDLFKTFFGATRGQRSLGAGTNFSRLRVTCWIVPAVHPDIAALIDSYGASVPDFVSTAMVQAPAGAPLSIPPPASPWLH